MLDIISIVADFAGIISFIISICTFVVALRIRRRMLIRVEKASFFNEIDGQVANLLSYYETITTDNVYNSDLLVKIEVDLEDILIAYSCIIPKEVIAQIKKLRNLIKNKCQVNIHDRNARTECVKQLHSISSKLAKEKKVL